MTGTGAVVRELTVPDGAIPVRVDRYVTDATGLSRSHVQKLIAAGNLTGADGAPLRSNVIVGGRRAPPPRSCPRPIPLALEPEPDIVLPGRLRGRRPAHRRQAGRPRRPPVAGPLDAGRWSTRCSAARAARSTAGSPASPGRGSSIGSTATRAG